MYLCGKSCKNVTQTVHLSHSLAGFRLILSLVCYGMYCCTISPYPYLSIHLSIYPPYLSISTGPVAPFVSVLGCCWYYVIHRTLYDGECRKAERERIQSYQQDLDEMKQRVKQRPLLFEQAAQVSFHSKYT